MSGQIQSNPVAVNFGEDDLHPENVDQLDNIYTDLSGITFPTDTDTLIRSHGEDTLYWRDDKTVKLKEILPKLPQTEFSSLSDLSAAMAAITDTP